MQRDRAADRRSDQRVLAADAEPVEQRDQSSVMVSISARRGYFRETGAAGVVSAPRAVFGASSGTH
jgi:hypothetical protein